MRAISRAYSGRGWRGRLWALLMADPRPSGLIRPWNPVIAAKHAQATERLLLGWAGPSKLETAADRARRKFDDQRRINLTT